MAMIARQKQLKKEISLIPLINIIFLLLIFFMIAGQIQRFDTLEVSPSTLKEGREQRYLPITLYVDAKNNLALNGDKVQKKDIGLLLDTAIKNVSFSTSAITIKADKDAKATQLVWLMDEIKKLGVKEVSFIIEKEE